MMNADSTAVPPPAKRGKPLHGRGGSLLDKLPGGFKGDTLSGLTVALALVPEAVAFAFVAGVEPLIGLYSAFFLCLITAVLGGRPGMISGATGAMAVVVVSLVALRGIEYLFPAVILCGLIQVGVGALRLGKLIRLVPHPVMLGFVNGLAIVILLAQFGSFKVLGADGGLHYLTGTPLLVMLGLVALTMGIIHFLPKLTKAVPSSLAAILAVSLIAYALNSYVLPGSVLTVKDMLVTNSQAAAVGEAARAKEAEAVDEVRQRVQLAGLMVAPDPAAEVRVAQLSPAESRRRSRRWTRRTWASPGGLPRPFFLEYVLPPLTTGTLWIILPFALVLAGVGLIESLMTLTLIDELTETRGRGNRECVGQGVANVTCGLFGGMGGCAMIGQSLINVKSGGRGRLSGITAATALLLFILVLAPLIERVPMAALVGVMFMVVIGTFEWATLHTWRKVPASDVLVMVFVAGYTVFMHDLATAVILGVVISALVFAWQKSTHLLADVKVDEKGSKVYQLRGPLFFGSVASFRDLFTPAADPADVVIDFYYTRVYDQSGLEAINAVRSDTRRRASGCTGRRGDACRRARTGSRRLAINSRSPPIDGHPAWTQPSHLSEAPLRDTVGTPRSRSPASSPRSPCAWRSSPCWSSGLPSSPSSSPSPSPPGSPASGPALRAPWAGSSSATTSSPAPATASSSKTPWNGSTPSSSASAASSSASSASSACAPSPASGCTSASSSASPPSLPSSSIASVPASPRPCTTTCSSSSSPPRCASASSPRPSRPTPPSRPAPSSRCSVTPSPTPAASPPTSTRPSSATPASPRPCAGSSKSPPRDTSCAWPSPSPRPTPPPPSPSR